jgi:hypothetical protein
MLERGGKAGGPFGVGVSSALVDVDNLIIGGVERLLVEPSSIGVGLIVLLIGGMLMADEGLAVLPLLYLESASFNTSR